MTIESCLESMDSSEHLWTVYCTLLVILSMGCWWLLCCCGIRRKDAAQRGKQLKPLKLLLCFCHWFHEVATFMYIIVYSWSKKNKHTHNIIIIYDFVANLFWLFAANSRPNSQPGSWLFGDCLVRTIISMLIVSVSLTLYLLIFDLLGYWAHVFSV